MTRIWRYVLRHDDGMAPCPQYGVLSLCTCKPVIRRHAALGDWVIGFVPKRLGVGRVSWAGKVSEILSLGNYQRKYPRRRDAVYELKRDATEGEEEALQPLTTNYHASDKLRRRDWSGRNGLVFSPVWYFGGNGVEAPPEIAELAHYFVGQSAKGPVEPAVRALLDWLGAWGPPGFYGQPRDGLAIPGEDTSAGCAQCAD